MKYLVSALFFIISFVMYAFFEVIEKVSFKAIIAYLIVNQASYAEDKFWINFGLIKVVFLCFTVVFGILTIYSFIVEARKDTKRN